jgi:hypothetical protein
MANHGNGLPTESTHGNLPAGGYAGSAVPTEEDQPPSPSSSKSSELEAGFPIEMPPKKLGYVVRNCELHSYLMQNNDLYSAFQTRFGMKEGTAVTDNSGTTDNTELLTFVGKLTTPKKREQIQKKARQSRGSTNNVLTCVNWLGRGVTRLDPGCRAQRRGLHYNGNVSRICIPGDKVPRATSSTLKTTMAQPTIPPSEKN